LHTKVSQSWCDGLINHHLIAHFLLSRTVKEFRKQSTFGEDMGSRVSCFFYSLGTLHELY